MRELATQGLRQKLLCRSPGRLAESAAKLGIETHYIKHWLVGHHRKFPVDLWHAHDGKAVYWAALQHKLYGKPYFITRRVAHSIKSNPGARAAYRNASRVVCLSHAIDNQVLELEPRTRRTIIPSSFSTFRSDLQRAAAIRSQYADKFLVGQVGSLFRIKGQHITIEAARLLSTRLPQVHFLFLGDGPERDALAKDSAGLSNLSILGHQRDIGPYFQAFDLFILPSLLEGLGSSILEAMQARTPVLASNVGGIPDVVNHQVTGWLVNPGDPAELAEAIEHLYRNPELRQQLAQKASENLTRFSPKAVAASYLRLYRSVIDAS